MQRLEVVVATTNLPSLRVAAKVGAVREGVTRSRFQLRGSVHDAVVFSLVGADLLTTAAIAGEARDEGAPSPHGARSAFREGCPDPRQRST